MIQLRGIQCYFLLIIINNNYFIILFIYNYFIPTYIVVTVVSKVTIIIFGIKRSIYTDSDSIN